MAPRKDPDGRTLSSYTEYRRFEREMTQRSKKQAKRGMRPSKVLLARVRRMVKEDPSLTAADIAPQFGLSEAGAQWYIDLL